MTDTLDIDSLEEPNPTEADQQPSPADIGPPTTEPVLETGPIIWPVVAIMGAIVLVTVGLIIGLAVNPELVGSIELAEILINAILILAILILARYGLKVLILRRTTYAIYPDRFRRHYRLFYRENARTLPIEQLRGVEFDRGRFQTLFGCATVRLLTAGTDRSIGFIEFESVANAADVTDTIEAVRQEYRNEQS